MLNRCHRGSGGISSNRGGFQMLRSIVTVIILLLAIPMQTHAQTVGQAVKFDSFLDGATRDLAQVKTNLLDMSGGMPVEESIHMDTIDFSIRDTECILDKLSIVGKIYSVINDKRERGKVKQFYVSIGKHAVRASNRTVANLNRELSKVRSPAAIAEVQKARDLILRIRDEIQETVPGS